MERLADWLDMVNRATGLVVRWLALLMVLVQFGIVLLRYVFGISFIWLNESVLYMHGGLFMLGAGYALLVDEHVRVDIFYSKAGARGKARIDTFGHLFLLFPSMAMLLYWSWPSVRNSWAVLEGPVSVGGIPASFLLKSLIPAFAVLVMVQALARLLRDVARLAGGGR
ncbi:MAG TPA: TRAP transporter small permease subunit [Paracoccaceae bacterium]|nr:TRAP transporter small permease subunit [Paracoccaceae bacterium]